MINFPGEQSVVTMYPDYYTAKEVIKDFDNVKRLFLRTQQAKMLSLRYAK